MSHLHKPTEACEIFNKQLKQYFIFQIRWGFFLVFFYNFVQILRRQKENLDEFASGQKSNIISFMLSMVIFGGEKSNFAPGKFSERRLLLL